MKNCPCAPNEWGEINAYLEDDAEICADVGEVTVIHQGYDPYQGPYEVTPKTQPQTLETTGKNMEGDVLVHQIPYAETTNTYGTTVIIAS